MVKTSTRTDKNFKTIFVLIEHFPVEGFPRMVKSKQNRLGGLAPMYNFVLNPYPDKRLSKCPYCDVKTGQRKVPLLIHIDPRQLFVLNYTCRYCRHCALLIGHKHEIEGLIGHMAAQRDASMIGNDYLILGTVEKKAWRQGLTQPMAIADMLAHAHDFKMVYGELRMLQMGWFPEGEEPPVREPPTSTVWIKSTS